MSTKISQLTSATDVTANDLIQIVDVEDGVMAPSGTNKKATASLLANQLVPLITDNTIAGSKIADSGITSSKIADGTIVNADINASAAIAGTKINPNFGSQNIATTGTLSAGGITSAGNVGIGTSSPSEVLDAYGSIRFGAPNIGRIYSTDGTRGSIQISAPNDLTNRAVSYGNNYYINSSGAWTQANSTIGGSAIELRAPNNNYGEIIFRQKQESDLGGAERIPLVITPSGNVGIGTGTPSYQLELSLDSAAKPSTSTWTVSSDERLKENIEAADLDICYNAVKSIPLKRYKWKDEIYSEEQVADRNKIGWIAQDVQAVFPKAVSEHKFVYNQVKDEDGNVVSEDSIDDCLSLNSDQLYAALFGAVQKLMGEVESLQGRIAELESAP